MTEAAAPPPPSEGCAETPSASIDSAVAEPEPVRRTLSRGARHALRALGLTMALLAGFAIFGWTVSGHYAPQLWLIFDYAKYWGLTVIFNAACLVSGFAALRKLIPSGMALRERLVLSMAVGVLLFFLGMFVGGILHLYGVVFFIAFPSLLLLGGGAATWRFADRSIGLWLRTRRHRFRRWSLLETVMFAGGVVALTIIYAAVIVPENSAYDAKWYHLPIAEHYVAIGGIAPFVEGWYQGALPHLSSLLYTWAMLLPVGPFVDKVLTCAHLEFSLFLWTIAAIPVLVRLLVPTARPRLAWVAMFLFPGLFLYDSSLGIAADHVAAFWAIPLFIALVHVWPSLELRWAVLVGAMLAAAMLTKYQAASLVALPILGIVARCVWLTLKARRGHRFKPFLGAATAGLVMIVLFAPHWVKNWVWYGDPAYPWLHKYFQAKQWTPDTAVRLESIYTNHLWTPKGETTGEKLLATAKAVATFSFVPNDWNSLHGEVPVFGSLFTLLFLALPFLRAPRRLWGLFWCANMGVFVWYWMSHQDRYLQALVPWMAAFTAAALLLAWRSGPLVRGAVVLLVGLQVAWGSDVPFIGTHRQIGQSPLKFAVDRAASGYNKAFDSRLGVGSSLLAVGQQLPADAVVLTHEEEQHLGLMRRTISDWSEWQGGLSYGRFKSPAEVHDRLVAYGVTHIVQMPERSRDSDALPGDIVYYDYVTHFAKLWKNIAPWKVMTIAAQRPAETPYRPLLWLGCENLYDDGVYEFSAMMTPFWGKRDKATVGKPLHGVSKKDSTALDSALAEVDSVAYDPRCFPIPPPSMPSAFIKVAMRGPVELWIRRR